MYVLKKMYRISLLIESKMTAGEKLIIWSFHDYRWVTSIYNLIFQKSLIVYSWLCIIVQQPLHDHLSLSQTCDLLKKHID